MEHTETVTPVDPLRFPLHGSRLIEASAGTGKTFTIAALYLRLVLGHGNADGGDAGFVRPLDPPEILVVTFTEAATLELRDRIRARLSEAAAWFRQGIAEFAGAKAADQYLEALRSSYPEEAWAVCAARLQLAAEWMDEAAVSTIHGWCSRMLREHAFDSGSLFSLNPAENDAELRAEAMRDYWRTFVQQFGRDDARLLAGWWPDFEAFCAVLNQGQNLSRLLAVAGDALTPAAAILQMKAALDDLKQPWRAEGDGWAAELKRRLLLAHEKKHVSGSRLRLNTLIARLDALAHWAETDGMLWPVEGQDTDTPKDWGKSKTDGDPLGWIAKNLSAPALADRAIWKNPELTDHPAFGRIAMLGAKLRALDRFRGSVLLHAARWIDRRHRQAREQRSELGFDDMLLQLDRALQAEGGEVLARRIRQQFPVALIDEFQDTDPLQYRIFDRVYRVGGADAGAQDGTVSQQDARGRSHAGPFVRGEPFMQAEVSDADDEEDAADGPLPHDWQEGHDGEQGAGAATTALILIGDPKQAIYAFRDADIHTYLRAREATRGRHYTLDTNYRSSTGMVEAVNLLFSQAEQRPGSGGAFRFARDSHNLLPFLPVSAAGRRDTWQEGGEAAPALTIWQPAVDDGDVSLGKRAYQARFARATATEIARLLRAGQQGLAGFGEHHPVKPADIAVLVNSAAQASLVRKALRAYAIPSVYLSDKESVYGSGVADDLLRFLMACAEPGDGMLLRTALGSRLAGLRPAELIELQRDERVWERRVADFQRYRQLWRQKGVLPMIRHLLQDFRVTERLLAAGQERQLTDVLHLAELLQQASTVLDGEHALIRHFREQRLDPSGDAESRRQRLESDDERVRVVTVHKSKGLEYPLVFIPFFCDVRAVDERALILSSHDEEGRPCHVLNLHADGAGGEAAGTTQALAAADEERLGEDLRKLYVALTRARHATWIGVDALDELSVSAAGHLLGVADRHRAADEEYGENGAPGDARDACLPSGAVSGPEASAEAALAAVSGARSETGKGRGRLQKTTQEKQLDKADKARAARQALADGVARLVAAAGRAATGRGATGHGSVVSRLPPDDVVAVPVQSAVQAGQWKALPALRAGRWQPWWIASYSALTNARHRDLALAGEGDAVPGAQMMHYTESAREDNWLEDMAALRGGVSETGASGAVVTAGADTGGVMPDARSHAPDISIHGFPRGPRPGSFLHALLEWAGQQGFARLCSQPALLTEEIARRLTLQPAWQPWHAVLVAWMEALMRCPLMPVADDRSGTALAGLHRYQVEMSFMLPVSDVKVAQLDAWICRHSFGGRQRPGLLPTQLNGMLKGVIDLVFEHEGRHFVLDYKSNWLGEGDGDYRLDNMEATVLHHRYELQFLLYVLALHRLLKARLPDYDYDRHVGGAIGWFMRGVGSATGGVFHVRPERLMIEALDAVFRGRLPLSSLADGAHGVLMA